jgi:hypothetical protein
MARAGQNKAFLILLLRGVLGGMVGGFIFAALEVCLIRPNGLGNWIGWLLIMYISVGLPFSVIIGTALSLAIWLFYHYTGIQLGSLARGTIGTIVGITACAMAWSGSLGEGYESNPLMVNLIGLVLMGAAFGGIPGIVIGSQRSNQAVSPIKTADSFSQTPQ